MKPKQLIKQVAMMILNKTGTSLFLLILLLSNSLIASDSNNGRKLYQQHCAMCHGNNGKSIMPGAADFNRSEGLFQPDQSLLIRIQSGKKACPAYLGILSEQKVFDVIAYIRTLHR